MKKIQRALQQTPRIISLEVTTRCNLNCVYCTKKEKEPSGSDIDSKLLTRILEQADNFDYVVICGIGESFCYPDIYELIHQLAKKKITIVTNGTIPIDYTKLNQKANINMLTFSVDAVDRELVKNISGSFNWDILIQNLKNLELYLETSQTKINRVLNCTINKYNLYELEKVVDFARQYHFEIIHFSLPRGFEDFIIQHKDILVEILKETRRKASLYGIYYFDPFAVCCVFGKWVAPYVSIKGMVYACCEAFYINNPLAGIQELNFTEIWKLKKYKEFQAGKICLKCRFLHNCCLLSK